MAVLTIGPNADFDQVSFNRASKSDRTASEALGAFDPVTLNASNQVIRSLGVAVGAAAAVIGVAAQDTQAGEEVTIIGPGIKFDYVNDGSIVPGAAYYLGAAGGIDSVTQLGDTKGLFIGVGTNTLQLVNAQTVGA